MRSILIQENHFGKVIRENIENGNIKEVFDVRNDNFLEKNRITGTEKN